MLPLLRLAINGIADAAKRPEQHGLAKCRDDLKEIAYLVVDLRLENWVSPQENFCNCRSSLSNRIKEHWQKVRLNLAGFSSIKIRQNKA